MKEESSQYINYITTDKGSFQIDYEYFNNYEPIIYLKGKEVNCDVEKKINLICSQNKN